MGVMARSHLACHHLICIFFLDALSCVQPSVQISFRFWPSPSICIAFLATWLYDFAVLQGLSKLCAVPCGPLYCPLDNTSSHPYGTPTTYVHCPSGPIPVTPTSLALRSQAHCVRLQPHQPCLLGTLCSLWGHVILWVSQTYLEMNCSVLQK